MADRGDAMATFQVGDWLFPRLHAVEEIARVPDVLILGVAGLVLLRLRPELWLWFRLGNGLGTADWMPADDAGHDVHRVFLLVSGNLEAIAAKLERAFGAVELEAAHAGLSKAGGAFTDLA